MKTWKNPRYVGPALAAGVSLLIATASFAAGPTRHEVLLPQAVFEPLPDPVLVSDPPVAPRVFADSPVLGPGPVVPGPTQPRTVPRAEPVVVPVAPSVRSSSASYSGVASWYCRPPTSRCTAGYSGGMYAAIRKDLLFLRGQVVTVCAGSDCIEVTVIDCNCGPNANLIDLYSDAFQRLAPLSIGVVRVTVSW